MNWECCGSQPCEIECTDYARKSRGGCCYEGQERNDDLKEYIFENSIDMDEMADASTAAEHYLIALRSFCGWVENTLDAIRYAKRELHSAIARKDLEGASLFYNRINMFEEALQNADITPESIVAQAMVYKKVATEYEKAREANENQCPLSQGCCMKG